MSCPLPDEIEISIFGPGFGESIVVHYGMGRWIVIDSCIDPISGLSMPLNYLEGIGVDVASEVDLVVVSHWHDDHTRGIGSLFQKTKKANIVFSSAINTKDFLELVVLYSKDSKMADTGISELSQIIRELEYRASLTDNVNYIPPIFAQLGLSLLKKKLQINAREITCELKSLSPSSGAILGSHLQISKSLPQIDAPKKSLIGLSKNDTSVALQLSIGEFSFLFGADLEHTPDNNKGWAALMNSDHKPENKSSFYKIAHHGSTTGHCDSVWNDLLEINPFCVLTPFKHGRTSLPTQSDVKRITSLSNKSYITSKGIRIRPVRDKTVEKTFKETVKSSHSMNVRPGYVTFRISVDGKNEMIQTSHDACKLSEYSSFI